MDPNFPLETAQNQSRGHLRHLTIGFSWLRRQEQVNAFIPDVFSVLKVLVAAGHRYRLGDSGNIHGTKQC